MTPAERRKRIELRRQRNEELAKQDRANRCAFCLFELPKVGAVTRFGETQRFCNRECLADADERDRMVTR